MTYQEKYTEWVQTAVLWFLLFLGIGHLIFG